MIPVCICELSFFDYVIRIGNLTVIVYFLLYFIENKFLVWLRKEEEWTVIDRQMLDTLFDNNEKNIEEEAPEVPELEQEAPEEAPEEAASEEEAEAPEEAPEEAPVNEEAEEVSTEMEMEMEKEEEAEASKILNETEIIDALMK